MAFLNGSMAETSRRAASMGSEKPRAFSAVVCLGRPGRSGARRPTARHPARPRGPLDTSLSSVKQVYKVGLSSIYSLYVITR